MKKEYERMAQAWAREPLLSRLQSCRLQLVLFGLLTEAENERVKRRIVAMVKKGERP